MRVCACLASARCPAALEALVGAACEGVRGAGGEFRLLRPGADATERVLGADALLLASPVLLAGLAGDVKVVLDGWLDRVARGDLVPRTARMHAGYLATYSPDDPEQGEVFHRQVRAAFAHFGMTFRGRAIGFEGSADASLPAVARRLGQVLAEGAGFAGYPEEYLAGIARFNRGGEFWEAHESWEEIWIAEETSLRLFYQGLIQVAAAFHHHGRGNWPGMASLLRQGREKLAKFLPRAMGLDLEGFLAILEPWRLLAEARCGRGGPVTRIPVDLPKIAIDPIPPDTGTGAAGG